MRRRRAGRGEDRASRKEPRLGSAQRLELFPRTRQGCGLLEDERTRRGDLVAADDDRLRAAERDRPRLGGRESPGALRRALARDLRLIDARTLDGEWYSQPLVEHPAVRRGRGENQWGHGCIAWSIAIRLKETKAWRTFALTMRGVVPIIRAPCRRTGRSCVTSTRSPMGEPDSILRFRSPSCRGCVHISRARRAAPPGT